MTFKKLVFQEDLSTSSDYLRMAVPLMIQRKIPPTPYNYALWYAHVQQVSPELSKALLERFPGAGTYDHDASESLFFEFFVKDAAANHQQTSQLFAHLVSQLARAVSRTVTGTQAYRRALQEAQERIDQAVDPASMRATLAQLQAETAIVDSFNLDLQRELQATQREVENLKRELAASRHGARRDHPTNLANRRAFDAALQQSLGTPDEPTCLLLLNLDGGLQRGNDMDGHPADDCLLKRVGGILESLQSETVFVARYDSEQFAVIVNDSPEVARELAETLDATLSALQPKNVNINDFIELKTFSIGMGCAEAEETAEELLARVDAALVRAKEHGHDRVVLAPARATAADVRAPVPSVTEQTVSASSDRLPPLFPPRDAPAAIPARDRNARSAC